MHRVRTADTQALVAMHEAHVALARAELALAQIRAGVAPLPTAPKPAAAPKAAKSAPKVAKPARPAFSGEIVNPDAPATARQLWALHLYLAGRPDTRGMTMTRAECSARIDAAKAAAAARKSTPAA